MQCALFQYIREDEHLTQYFKYVINDCEKIARSLSAFANTEGGRLLVGVKDNGNIVGVSSDEEFFMIDSAAHRYCLPEVPFTTYEWHVHNTITFNRFCRLTRLKPWQAERIVVEFISIGLIELVLSEQSALYRLKQV